MKKLVLMGMISILALNLLACSSSDKASSQTRTDLTEEHFNGLTANMKRSDVEDLVGTHDSSLSEKYSAAQNYFSMASKAIKEMIRISGGLAWDRKTRGF